MKFITSVLLGSQINNSNGTQNDQQDERKQNSKDSYQGHRIFEGTFSLPLPLRRPIFLRLVLPLQSFTRLFSLIYNQNRIITNILQGGLYMIVHIKWNKGLSGGVDTTCAQNLPRHSTPRSTNNVLPRADTVYVLFRWDNFISFPCPSLETACNLLPEPRLWCRVTARPLAIESIDETMIE